MVHYVLIFWPIMVLDAYIYVMLNSYVVILWPIMVIHMLWCPTMAYYGNSSMDYYGHSYVMAHYVGLLW